ncbi:hypothetical protein [Mycobacteroides stephanolepidis]|nr:hypothetical protein [[Mycobacterium] stephanolepidis]
MPTVGVAHHVRADAAVEAVRGAEAVAPADAAGCGPVGAVGAVAVADTAG